MLGGPCIRSSCRSTLSFIQCEFEFPTSFLKYQEISPMIEESAPAPSW